MEQVKKFFSFLRRHKLKFVLALMSALVFAFLLFPFDDLGDLVTAQVSKQTKEQVYVQFDNLHLSLIPSTGVALDGVYLEAQNLPPLKAQQLIFTPSISSLISQKPAGTLTAKGLLNGEVEVSMKPGAKSDNGVERQKITLNAKSLSIKEIREMVQQMIPIPILATGTANVSATALMDLTFQEQPDMDLNLKIDKLNLPSSTLQTPAGPVTLPDITFTSIELKGRWSAGQFLIEDGQIGREGDEVRGRVKGNLAFRIDNIKNPQKPEMTIFVPVLGGYSFEIELIAKKSFQEKFVFLGIFDSYKIQGPDTGDLRYKLKVSGPDFASSPAMEAMR